MCYKPTKYEGQPPLATRVMDRLRSGVPGLSPPSRPCPRCTASPATANWSECAPRAKIRKITVSPSSGGVGRATGCFAMYYPGCRPIAIGFSSLKHHIPLEKHVFVFSGAKSTQQPDHGASLTATRRPEPRDPKIMKITRICEFH